ncbi:MAG TPA: helix-turn-helix domain-containing protein [Thermoanaerobaculia bacterium]|nr:helix-turn-helix domain-containing protein [Thermoanaerobaculia bacterium]
MSGDARRPWEGEAETGSFGAWLRRQREVREISLREIAESSRISLRYLEAFEQDRFDLLPAPLFAKGFLREYAKFVGLDPDEVVNYYLSASPKDSGGERPQRSRLKPRTRVSPAAILGVVLFVLALVVAMWFLTSRVAGNADSRPAMAPPLTPAVPAAPAVAAEPEATAPIRLALDFHQKSWIEVFIDGERAVSEFRVQGESLRLSAQRELSLVLSNRGGVSVEVNGRVFALPAGASDQAILIDLDTVRELEGQS